jgi:hypothetical protein
MFFTSASFSRGLGRQDTLWDALEQPGRRFHDWIEGVKVAAWRRTNSAAEIGARPTNSLLKNTDSLQL